MYQSITMGSNDQNGKDITNLKEGIAQIYDNSLALWEDLVGDHIHHGFFDSNSSDIHSAQIRMIEEALHFASVSDDEELKKPRSILDVGCGVGGTIRYLASRYSNAQCTGITLSPGEVQRAKALTAAQGLEKRVSFELGDALNQPFPDGQFDLVFSVESAEYMPDKLKFVKELARVTAPGGTIFILSSCHRDLSPSEKALKPNEEKLLKKICDRTHSPIWCSKADFVNILSSLSLEDIKSADWTEHAASFLPAVMNLMLSWKGFLSVMRNGLSSVKGAMGMPSMIEGLKKGLVKYSIITCRKP